MPAVQVEAPLGEVGSTTIQFRNPFNHPLPMDVILTCIDNTPPVVIKTVTKGMGSHNRNMPSPVQEVPGPPKAAPAFGLLMKRTTDHVIAAKGLFQIALSFSPIILGAYDATVQIRTTVNGRSLLWCYPIVGIAEAGSALRLPTIKTACKTSFLKEVEIPLEGIRRSEVFSASDLLASDFTLESNYEDKVKSLVMRSFCVQLIEAVALPEDNDPDSFYVAGRSHVDYAMKCRFLFEPLRIFNTRVEVVLVYKNKGKWRVNVDLEATEREPDDRIKLCAEVGSQDKVIFRLDNRFLGYSNFQAHFTAKSSTHFAVTPSSGVLAPYGAEGSPFTVSFSPKEYGIIELELGTLVIQTEDAHWNYEVRGSYPDTAVNNNNIRSKVDTNRVGGLSVTVNGSYAFHK